MQYDAAAEFEGIDLGDRRRSRRLQKVVADIARKPTASFPKALGGSTGSEAFYRMINHDAVQHDRLVRHLSDRTVDRMAAHDGVTLVLHDTTEASWDGDGTRTGLTQRGNAQKMWLHTSIAVTETGAPRVLGILGNHAYVQREGLWHLVLDDRDGQEWTEPLDVGSDRWLRAMVETSEAVPSDAGPIVHVMDREGDAFQLLAEMSACRLDFVVRCAHDRRGTEDLKLFATLEAQPFVATREVVLTARNVDGKPPRATKGFPARGARCASLSVRFAPFELRAPDATRAVGGAPVPVYLVEVTELEPPDGAAPVHWRLLTSLPVTNADEALRIVDIYRRRWIIEEFFKALKTGCALRDRQGNSLRTLTDTIAILMPIAVGLLNLRAVARADPTADASTVVNGVQLQILRQMAPSRIPKRGRVTARHVMLAVASWGGHFKSNGEPGWQTLWSGWEQLLAHEAGWRAALAYAEHAKAKTRGTRGGSKM